MKTIMHHGRPFRADQVGSHLRPDTLVDARQRAGKGEIKREELRAIEDRCIREVVAMQEQAGLHCVTDGEFRRGSWNKDFLAGFDNVIERPGNLQVFHRNPDGTPVAQVSAWGVTGKIKRSHQIQVEDFKFLKSIAHVTPKTCMPSPTLLHFRGGRQAIDQTAYPDIDQFFADAAAAYRQEIDELYAAGARYIQLDDTNFAYLCDPRFRDAAKAMGEDPTKLVDTYIALVNNAIRNRPKDLLVAIHLCRGNLSTAGAAAGGYEVIGPSLFPGLDVDAYFLEYDDERAGGFEALKDVPDGKFVVLGLITTKRPDLESKDALKRRIDAAAKIVPLDRLCLSPQCGFASAVSAHSKTRIEDEKAKLQLLVQTATDVWGEA
ncbi:MAG TPA: 5-methyltetrahydropteroyltriglutamate--homocysteine S-methyltransferase [Stellaceae bacterium]|nr:5-methyltetrahydropteroyltriglutamate--homocysteine S-methyltransferase [Stellaceae bacterium]